ncbi:MAG: DUF4430 domain-containing protein [Thermoleophilia bacterium]|nr:DUF4430 domain-containing protein [Thermoleophilia bacterium]
MIRRAAALLVCLVVAGCGGDAEQRGTAELWITRDRGSEVLRTATTAAGISAMEALDRVAEVETRYGGRYVQGIDGLEGSLTGRRDWFYFVNGYEGDRSAADYQLHDGDVLWFDYRRWERPGEARLVVGAFPEPFLHGYAGRRRHAAVRFLPGLEQTARAVGKVVRADSVEPASVAAPAGANILYVRPGAGELSAAFCEGGSAGDPVCFTALGVAARLARQPALLRFRYEARG